MVSQSGVRVVPFEPRFAEEAAGLLAVGVDGAGVVLDDPRTALRRIEEWAGTEGAVGFAALDGAGRLLGFMGTGAPGGGDVRIRLAQHAAAGGESGRLARRALYAAVSERLVAAGALSHAAQVLIADGEAVAAFVELGFGIDQIRGFRPSRRTAWHPRVRRARPEELPRLVDLGVELGRFHELPPMWQVGSGDSGEHLGKGFERAFADGGDGPGGPHLVVVAEDDEGRPIGLMHAYPDSLFADAVGIGLAGVTADSRSTGMGTALLDAVSDWAAERGYGRCGAEWTSANPISDGFWRGSGRDLVPVMYRLHRVLDPGVRRPGDGPAAAS